MILPNIHDLARRRAEAQAAWRALLLLNQRADYSEQMALDVRIRHAFDLLSRAERDYSEAIAKLSTEELVLLAKQPVGPESAPALSQQTAPVGGAS